MKIRTTEKNGNKNYVHVTPETINDLLSIMEHGYDQVRDSFDNFRFAILDNIRMEIMFEPDNVIYDLRINTVVNSFRFIIGVKLI